MGASHWLGVADYAVDVKDATFDNDQIHAIATGLVKASVFLLHAPEALAELVSTLMPSDDQMDRELNRVLGGLDGAVDLLGIHQTALMDRRICFTHADDREGQDLAACVATCARAGNSLSKPWKEVSIQVVVYWLRSPSNARLDDALDALPDEEDWGCNPSVSVVPVFLNVNRPRDQWPLQPTDSDDAFASMWLASHCDFHGSAIPELLGLARSHSANPAQSLD